MSWQIQTLREAGVQLIDCDHRTPAAQEEGYPYIAIPQLVDGRIKANGARRISKTDYEDWTRKLRPQAYDVVVVRRCNSGESAHVPPEFECAIGQNLVVLRSDGTAVLPVFLRWLVRSDDWWNEVRRFVNVGAVFDSLRCKDIPNFSLPIPPRREQEGIAGLLTALDDRIELLREANATLEAIAQALFKSWFVDFDPVRAKSEGRTPGGMDEATAALFPDSFEDSPLGPIPTGWTVDSLDSIADFRNGLAMQKYPPLDTNDQLPVIKIAQLRKGSSVGADLASRKIKTEYIVNDGDVLFSWSGSLEVEIWCGGEGALNQHLFKVTSTRFDKWFYLLWTKHHLNNFRSVAAGKATTMGHIQRSHLTDATVLIPDALVQSAASGLLGSIVDRLVENNVQAKTLEALRDGLLPRLTSGQLRIPEARDQVTKVLAATGAR